MILFKSSEVDRTLLVKPTENVPSLSQDLPHIYLFSSHSVEHTCYKIYEIKKIVKIIVIISLVHYAADISMKLKYIILFNFHLDPMSYSPFNAMSI